MFTSQNIGPSGRMCLAAKRILIAISISAKPAFEVMDARHSKPRSIAFRNMLSPSDVSTCKRILVVPASALCACEPQCVYVCARHNSRWYLDSLSLSLSLSLSRSHAHAKCSTEERTALRWCANVALATWYTASARRYTLHRAASCSRLTSRKLICHWVLAFVWTKESITCSLDCNF